MVAITAEKQNKGKRMKATEGSLRNNQDNVKYSNILIIEVSEEQEMKRSEKFFEDTIVKNFPSMGK